MKQGMTFEALVTRVEQEATSRRDYYVPTPEMHLLTDATGSRLATPCGNFGVKETAHLHLAELCGIDRRYYQRMRTEAPFLLDRNVNHWLATNPPKQRIVRALERPTGAEARAVVSSRYAMLDNDALLKTVEPVLSELDLTVESCDVGEEKLYIKMISPRLTGTVKVGDDVQAGVIVRNSEVRCSAVEVDWFVKRLVCTNGMVLTGAHGQGASRRHVGRDWDATQRKRLGGRALEARALGAGAVSSPFSATPAYGLIPVNTERKAWERDIWDQLQTSLRASLNADAFTTLLERLRRTTTMYTGMAPDTIVERLGNTFHLHPAEQATVLSHLTRDEDMSLWGLLNAVTRTAEDVTDYHRATELEELGGHLAHLSPQEWGRLINPN